MPSHNVDSPRQRSKFVQSSTSGQPTGVSPGILLDETKSPMAIRSNMGVSKALAVGAVLLAGTVPILANWGVTMGLIFGGCCSNVFALEGILKIEPDSGLLLTLVQFLTIFCFTLPSHLDFSNPPAVLKKRAVPILHWLPAIAMFFTVNMLNNYAFGFSISVPVHIILRSGGSVTTMVIGYLWGKRYNRGQVLGVAMLTIGVIIAALSDAKSKGKMEGSSSGSMTSFIIGLTILFIAQVISAWMGIYIQLTYAKYGPHWHENLFYSHFLSLPLFLPLLPSLWHQFQKLMNSPPVMFNIPRSPWFQGATVADHDWKSSLDTKWSPRSSVPGSQFGVPIQLINLAVNAITQYACIRGVNMLGTKTTALGVTIVLNLRKLVSLFLSIWLFGNKLPIGVALGAAIVFGGAAVYGYAGQQPKTQAKNELELRNQHQHQNHVGQKPKSG